MISFNAHWLGETPAKRARYPKPSAEEDDANEARAANRGLKRDGYGIVEA